MKKILLMLLGLTLLLSCNQGNDLIPDKSEKLTESEFNSYSNKMDSIAKQYPKPTDKQVFRDIKFGEKRSQVSEKLFQYLEKREINYDSESFYINSLYNKSDYRFIIELSYADDILYGMKFKCENDKKGVGNYYDRKMALLHYFKECMRECKLLNMEGKYYNDALKYDGTIRYDISGNSMYIEDLKLLNQLINIDESQAIVDMIFGN